MYLDGGYDDYQIYDHFYSFACSKQALHRNTISSSDSSFTYLHSAKAMFRFPRTFFRASSTVHTPETHPNRLANMNRKPDINLQTHGILSIIVVRRIHLAFSTRTNRDRPLK